jgi:N-acetylglucosaminyldiphosphoundecaprenol N-acetyl-beta-D-mannosaminyltransferase
VDHEEATKDKLGTLGVPGGDAVVSSDRLEILGVPVDHVTADEAVERIAAVIRAGSKAHVVTVNPEFVMAARRDPVFMAVLRDAQLALADGVGMVWASRLLGRPLPERVAGVDVLPRIAHAAAGLGRSVFLLGAAPGVAERAAAALISLDGAQTPPETLEAASDGPRAVAVGPLVDPIGPSGALEAPRAAPVRSSAAIVAGVFSGSPSDTEAESIVRLVNESAATVLFVAFGSPAQDVWIARHRDDLRPQVMMGVGGAFDFLAGERRRAPERLRRVGLEWLWRLAAEPRRWRRQLALPRFAAAVAVDAVRRRL